MVGGDFTPEAYEQLKEAYAKEAQDAKAAEQRGHDIMGLNLGLETAPVDSPWADLIPNTEYPSGKSQYLDEKQDPAAILELMRNSVAKPVEEEEESEEEEEDTEVLSDEDEVEEEAEDDEDEEDEEEGEGEDEDDEVEEEESDEEEEGEVEEEFEDEVEETEDEDVDAEDIAAQIAELRAEIEQMQFVPGTNDDES